MQSRRLLKERASQDEKRRALASQQAQLAKALLDGHSAPPGFHTESFRAAAESLRVKKARESASCNHDCKSKSTVAELHDVFVKPQKSPLARGKDVISSLFFRRPSH